MHTLRMVTVNNSILHSILHFIGLAKPTVNNSKLRMVTNLDTPSKAQKIDLVELHYTPRSKFFMIQSIFFGAKERIPQSEQRTVKSHIIQYI